MKILFLIPSLNFGGTERQVIILTKELAKLGNNVIVGYFYDGPLLKNTDSKYVKFRKIEISNRKSPIVIFKIASLISRENPDIVQTFLSYMDIFGGLASFILNKPFVLSERSNGINEADKKIIIFLKSLILNLSGTIICNSIYGKKFWMKTSPKSNVIFIPNIVKKSIDQKVKKVFSTSNFKILVLSRFNEHKNTLLTVEIFCEHQKTFPESEFIFVGDGDNLENCIAYVKKNSIDKKQFKFIGFKKYVKKYFLKCDLFVSLSKFEGMPNAALEAASFKCPMVLSNIPAHINAFSSKEAFFVPLNNKLLILNTIKKALNSPNLRKKKALQSYNSILKNNDSHEIAVKYNKKYSQLFY